MDARVMTLWYFGFGSVSDPCDFKISAGRPAYSSSSSRYLSSSSSPFLIFPLPPTKRFHWKASPQDSFGKHRRGILLESLTIGILRKPPQNYFIGKPRKRNLLESTAKGFHLKASQQDSSGEPHRGILLESTTH